MIPGEKVDDFGLHAHKYYKVEHGVFKSQLDSVVLDRLWNEYWIHTLSSSPILTNKDFINKSVVSVVEKLNRIVSLNVPGSGKRGTAKPFQGNNFQTAQN
jgi:COP9 signalosome complex subunit 5